MPRAPPKIATTPKKKANSSKASSGKSPRKSVERPARKAKAESVKRTSEVYHPPPAPKPEPTLKKEKVAKTETTTAKNSKSGKKKSGPTKGGHPSYKDMIQEAITSLCKTDRGRRGASRRAILTYVMVKFTKDQAEHLVNNRLKRALRAGLDDGLFKQTSGTGVSGSFKNT